MDEQKDTVQLWKDKLGASGSVTQPVLSTILPRLGISAFLLYLRSDGSGRGLGVCSAQQLTLGDPGAVPSGQFS